MKDVMLANGRVLTEDEVAEYFHRLRPRQLRNNKGIREAARAMLRLQQRHARGPGRPPVVVHDPGKKTCLCADCRRTRFPSYRHEPYRAKEPKQKRKPEGEAKAA